MDYKKFESIVYELERILSNDGAKVSLNEKVRDQFTGELRQVDIVIDREGHRICVECRAHKPKQNVKWIEELVGRAESIGAQEIIGASLSGFTSPAIKMAKARGIGLRDLSSFDADDVTGWGKRIEIKYKYCAFSDVNVNINLLPQYCFGPVISYDKAKEIYEFLVFNGDFLSSFLGMLCKSSKFSEKDGLRTDVNYRAKGRFCFGSHMVFKDFYISSIDVDLLVNYHCNSHHSTFSRIYRDPNVGPEGAVAAVSLFDDKEWSVFRGGNKSSISIDCKDFEISGNTMVYETIVSGLNVNERFRCELKNPLRMRSDIDYLASVSCSFIYTPIMPNAGGAQFNFRGRDLGFVT